MFAANRTANVPGRITSIFLIVLIPTIIIIKIGGVFSSFYRAPYSKMNTSVWLYILTGNPSE